MASNMKHLKHELFFLLLLCLLTASAIPDRVAGDWLGCSENLFLFLSWQSPATEGELQRKVESHAEPLGHDK